MNSRLYLLLAAGVMVLGKNAERLRKEREDEESTDDRYTITEAGIQALRESKLGGEVKAGCIDHPDVPHGYDRNASHDAGEYRCLCDSWASGDSE